MDTNSEAGSQKSKSEYLSKEPSEYLIKNYPISYKKEEKFSDKAESLSKKVLYFLFVSVPEFIGESFVYLFENIYRVIRIDIGIFNADKIELSETINKLKYKIVELRDENLALDNDNYLLTSANKELVSAGIDMHDELVGLYGEDNYLVLKWKKAEGRAGTKLEIDYSESSEYLSVRQRRDLELWASENMENFPFQNTGKRRHIQPKSKVKTTKTKTAAKTKRSKN